MSPQEQLDMMCTKLETIQKQLANLQRLVSPKNGGAPKVVYKPVIVGVKDVSSASFLRLIKEG